MLVLALETLGPSTVVCKIEHDGKIYNLAFRVDTVCDVQGWSLIETRAENEMLTSGAYARPFNKLIGRLLAGAAIELPLELKPH